MSLPSTFIVSNKIVNCSHPSIYSIFLCTGSGRFLSPPKGACMLGTAVYNSGTQFYVDECTRCSCANSAISCVKETCPVLECTSEYPTTLPGRCCPPQRRCPLVEESRTSCTYGGRTYGASIFFNFISRR